TRATIGTTGRKRRGARPSGRNGARTAGGGRRTRVVPGPTERLERPLTALRGTPIWGGGFSADELHEQAQPTQTKEPDAPPPPSFGRRDRVQNRLQVGQTGHLRRRPGFQLAAQRHQSSTASCT